MYKDLTYLHLKFPPYPPCPLTAGLKSLIEEDGNGLFLNSNVDMELPTVSMPSENGHTSSRDKGPMESLARQLPSNATKCVCVLMLSLNLR